MSTAASGPFPSLPAIADAYQHLVLDDRAWSYPSACGAGGGVAHTRVWRTAQIPGHLAIVTETGVGATVTNSAAEIWTKLAGAYRGPLTVLEHWPAEHSAACDRLDQVVVTDRRPAWRRVWPTPPSNPQHETFTAWMDVYGHALLAAHRAPHR